MDSLHDGIQLIDFINNLYASALVGVFSGFNYPYISSFLFGSVSFLFFPLFLLDDGLSPVVIGDKPLILWIFEAFLDVEGQWKILEYIISY